MVPLEALKSCKLLELFSPEELEVLARHFTFVQFKPGELLFDEFEPPKGFYLIMDGRVGLFRSDNFGRWTKIAAVYGGSPLGECALFLNSPHSLRAVAETELKALFLSKEEYEKLKEESPLLLMKLLEVVLKELSNRLKEEDRKYAQVCGFFSVGGGSQWRR